MPPANAGFDPLGTCTPGSAGLHPGLLSAAALAALKLDHLSGKKPVAIEVALRDPVATAPGSDKKLPPGLAG